MTRDREQAHRHRGDGAEADSWFSLQEAARLRIALRHISQALCRKKPPHWAAQFGVAPPRAAGNEDEGDDEGDNRGDGETSGFDGRKLGESEPDGA